MAIVSAVTAERVSLKDFAAILELDVRQSAANLALEIDERLTDMGIRDLCYGCGGSGRQVLAGNCWRTCPECGGRGYTVPPLTPATYERVERAVAKGRLRECLERQELDRIAKEADRKVWRAWQGTGILDRCDWANALAHVEGRGSFPEDARLAELNVRMRNAYLAVADVVQSCLSTRSVAQKRAILARLQETVEQALRTIEMAAAEM